NVLCADDACALRAGRTLPHRGTDRTGIRGALMNETGSRAALLRRSLAALGYLAAVGVLLVLTVSAVTGIFDQRAAIASSADLLAQLEGRRAPSRRPGETQAPAIPTGSPFLEGQTLTVAGAALLQRVADAVTKVGGSVLSSQVDVQGVQAKDGYVSV